MERKMLFCGCWLEGGVSVDAYPPPLQGDWVRVREKEVAQPCKYDAQLCRTDLCRVEHYLHRVKAEQAAMEKSSLHFEGDALTGFTF